MPPRVYTLTPHTWEKVHQRHPFTLVRLEHGARGMPAVIANALDGQRVEGITFTTMDLGTLARPEFWLNSFRTQSGPIQRSGDRPQAGYYLFRNGIIIAHHPAGARIDTDMVAAYLRERLLETPDPDMHEQRWAVGAGVRVLVRSFERGSLDDQIFNYTDRPKGCWLHDDVWFGGHVVSSLDAVPYLIDPGFKSRKVRRIEHDRSKSSSYLQTLKLREHGDDPEAQCASSFDYMRDAVHRGHHKSAGGHR